MEDLRDVGKKVIDVIKNTKPVDAGDLVLGIGNIIEELRGQPDQFEAKLDHLEGLFRELAYGESYELREPTPDAFDIDVSGGFIAASGAMIPPSGWMNNIPVSGSFSMGHSAPPLKAQMPNPGDIIDPQPLPASPQAIPQLPENEYPEPKPFKKRWWNRQDESEDDNG